MWKFIKEERAAFGILIAMFFVGGFAYQPLLDMKAKREAGVGLETTEPEAIEELSNDEIAAPLLSADPVPETPARTAGTSSETQVVDEVLLGSESETIPLEVRPQAVAE